MTAISSSNKSLGEKPPLNGGQLEWIASSAKYLLLVSAVSYVVMYVAIVFLRINYPFDLNWMEGAAIDWARRMLLGNKLYVEPSLENISHIYTPLYTYISALMFKVFGVGYVPMRIVSFLSSLGCMYVIFLFIKRETRNSFAALVGASLYAATFHITGGWFDMVKGDSFFLFLMLLAVYLVRFRETSISYIVAGVIVFLSFLTKQTAFVISLPLMLYCVITNWRLSIYFIVTVFLLVFGSTYLMNNYYDGWYIYYIYEWPTQHPVVKKMLVMFWTQDIYSKLPIAAAMSALYVLVRFFDQNKKHFLFYFLFSAGMIGGAWSSRMHSGGSENVLFPAYALISILFGLALHTFLDNVKDLDTRKRSIIKALIFLVCFLQFASGRIAYNPMEHIPSQRDIDAGWELVDMVSKIDGEVIFFDHGYLPVMAGKKSHAHGTAIYATFASDNEEINSKLRNEIREALQSQKFSAIIIDIPEPWFPPDLEKYYTNKGPIFADKDVFWTVAGWKRRPEYLFVPKALSD